MANALPMLERCFERQWAGLSPFEREIRECATPGHAATMIYGDSPETYPLWHLTGTNASQAYSAVLISVKID